MRVLHIVFGLLIVTAAACGGESGGGAAAPETPAAAPGGGASAGAPTGQPHASLAQLMRGVLFPNSNILFDVQSADPAAPKKVEGSGATATFANIYTGWQTVENAALTLAESATLIMMPGRLCENGKPVPLDREDFRKAAQELVSASMEMYKAAQSKNQEKASDATNVVAGACENCHMVYREKPDPAGRCIP